MGEWEGETLAKQPVEITTYATFKTCPEFHSSIGNPDFTEFYCIINLLILFCLFSFSHSLLNCILLLMYVCSGPVRGLLKFCHGYLKSTATSDLYYYL